MHIKIQSEQFGWRGAAYLTVSSPPPAAGPASGEVAVLAFIVDRTEAPPASLTAYPGAKIGTEKINKNSEHSQIERGQGKQQWE